jgi:hypothetical protein
MHAHRIRGLVALVAGALVLSSIAACTSAGGNGDGPTINHVQVAGDKPAGEPVAIEAQVSDPNGVASVSVFFQAPHAGAWNSAPLDLSAEVANTYHGEIPGTAIVAPSVSYYLEAKSSKGVTTRLPSTAPAAWFTITVAGSSGDSKGPTISHVKIADGRTMGSTVTASAKVTDETGVANVVCRYRAQGATDWIPMTMTTQGNDTYQANFPITVIIPPAVEYYLEAVDTAPGQNHSTLPLNAPEQVFTFTVSPGDETPPVITHTPIADGQPEGRPVAVVARIEDASLPLARAEVFYRTHGTTTWETLTMTQSGTSGQWSALLPASAATTAGVDYYIEAVDGAPLANVGRAPETAPDDFYSFTTAPETCVVPPLNPETESFEAGIFPGWWRTYGSGIGCEWTVDATEGHDGTHSAKHYWGTSCNDLLVLPCLDLTGLQTEGLVLDFWQNNSYLSTTEHHTFEWAETNPDPAASTYKPIGSEIQKENTSDTWGYRKIVIPAGAPMLGKSKVYFAFRYNGDDEWTWYLDQIRVRPPGPAIELSNIAATPNPVNAGTADVVLNVTLRNSGDGPSAALNGTLTTTDAGITITTGSATFAGVAAGGETTSGSPFHLSVDAGHANGEAPLKLQVTDGTHIYNIDIPLFVGPRAAAHIVMRAGDGTYESETELYLGVGIDPLTPTWVSTTNIAGTGTSGTYTYDVDLTAQVGYLPPTLPQPWFLKAIHKYYGTLEIKEFTIAHGASIYSALSLPWVAADSTTTYPYVPATSYLMLPEPPRFVAEPVVTVPATLAPGSNSATATITVRNLGSATQGALSGTLSLKDPTTATDVTGLTPTTAVSFASGPVGNNGTATGASSFTFNVTTAHNDGSPLHFKLHLEDLTTHLTWDVPVDVQVPWPGITVVDWGSLTATLDSDGVPDPGEAYELILVVQNTGSLVTAGPVTATLAINAASAGLATIATDTMTFGNTALAAGQKITSTSSVKLTLTGAQVHQKVLVDATFTDGTNTWHRTVPIPIYAHVGSSDPQDATYGSPDLRFMQFNCDNTTLDVRLIGWSTVRAENAAVSVIIAHPTSGAALRLATYSGAISAYTLTATGAWEAATVPASLTVTPAEGDTIYLNFRVALADVSAYVVSKQVRLGAQADGYSSVYDSLPDAWSDLAPAHLVLVPAWP